MTLDSGEVSKREGMARVDEYANPPWKELVDEYLDFVALHEAYLSTEIIKIIMAYMHPNIKTHDDRAYGPRMKAAAKRGVIEITPDTTHSITSSRHKGDVRTWHSLIFPKPHPQPSRRKPIDPFTYTYWWRK